MPLPQKEKTYDLAKFPPEVIEQAIGAFDAALGGQSDAFSEDYKVFYEEDESWDFPNIDEFFSEYRKEIAGAHLNLLKYTAPKPPREVAKFGVFYRGTATEVTVKLVSRADIERVFAVFEANYERYRQRGVDAQKTIQERVGIFIGHGRSPLWRDLKDHLHEKHGFSVIAYETGARAGYTITRVLENIAEETSFALLVHTGEDLGTDGVLRTRENVIHETGLFQGLLGFERAIILLEDGCNEFTNLEGTQQIRFSKGNIKEVFGEVLATIYREFGDAELAESG